MCTAGNLEHETTPFQGTRISFIAFTSTHYKNLHPWVAKTLLQLGFNAARSDGIDLRFFERFRIEKNYLSSDHNKARTEHKSRPNVVPR